MGSSMVGQLQLCGYPDTTTGHPCRQVVSSGTKQCAAGHAVRSGLFVHSEPSSGIVPVSTGTFEADELMGAVPAPTEDDPIVTLTHLGLPAATFFELTHIGTMDESHKKGWSLEGDGLSVSTEPESWSRIARLGGFEWWTLSRDQNRFLDAHALSDEDRKRIFDWGMERGYVDCLTAWSIPWYDDEMEQWVSNVFDSEDEALAEAESMCIEEAPTPFETLRATDAFPDKAGRQNADQVLLCIWAEETTDFDGVWWDDDDDPLRLSAPRAVILKSRLSEWNVFAAS